VNIDDVEQVRTRWRNRGTPERAEVLIRWTRKRR